MRRFLILLLALGAVLAAAPDPAQAQKRIALLIGNQSYSAEVGRLANPHNDVALLEKTLKDLGFAVTAVRDAGLAGLHQAVNGHVRRVRAAGPNAVGFFYYSGHGAQDAASGINYLIPTDVKSAEDGDLWDVSLRLTHITRQLKAEAGNATHFVVFDACRNALKLRIAGSRSLVQSKGFVPVAQENGMLIAYATAEGELASDVGVGAGPYAKVLAEEMVKPGVEAVAMFRNVQLRVSAEIGQEPWIGFSALQKVHFAGAAPDAKEAAPAARLGEAAEAWAATKDTQSVAALEAFVRRFGDTYYGDLARVRLSELKQADAKKADDEARRKAALEQQRLALLQQKDEERKRAASQNKGDARAEWILFGTQTAGFQVDRDVIKINHSDLAFRRLHLVAEKNDIHLISLRIVYANGSGENFQMDRLIRKGEQQPVDFRAERRNLQRIEMIYRSRLNTDGQQGIMKVYGEPVR
jgi:uncharacterized caspase-like protein